VVREVFNPTKDLASLYPVERTSSRALQQVAESAEVTSSGRDPNAVIVDPVQLRLDERNASEAVMRSVGALGNLSTQMSMEIRHLIDLVEISKVF
jgi:hypothetical protein